MLNSFSKLYTRRCISLKDIKKLSTVIEPDLKERGANFRCLESNPVNHSVDNIAQFYSIPKEDQKVLFTHGGLTTKFKNNCETFNETCLMIRKPSLHIINCLKELDYSKPACRFVLYGIKGSGKSLSLAHVVHFGYKYGFLLIHVPWVGNWMRKCKESSNSVMKEGLIDLNIDSAIWLGQFKTQNAHILNSNDFKLSQEYVWNKRESIAKDAPLLELIEFGINRVKYASYVVNVLTDELKNLSKSNKFKTLVVIDGFNAFFYPNTRILTEKKQVVHPDKVSLTGAFLKLTDFDWNNAAIVLTVDEIAAGQMESPSFFPRYLLGKEGFEHVDPFIPIPVENYSEKEFLSCVEYLKDRQWIQQYYPGLEDELAFVSNKNPYKLLDIVSSL